MGVEAGAESYDSKKAWSSMNRSILSACPPRQMRDSRNPHYPHPALGSFAIFLIILKFLHGFSLKSASRFIQKAIFEKFLVFLTLLASLALKFANSASFLTIMTIKKRGIMLHFANVKISVVLHRLSMLQILLQTSSCFYYR
jgi:hypothetical protein